MVSSRKEALASNHQRYFTGKPCKRDHISERYAITGMCIACAALLESNWRKENRERRAEKQRMRRATPEGKQKVSKYNKAWVKANPRYGAHNHAQRRYIKFGYNYKMPWQDLDEIKQFYYDTPEGMTVDHIIPIKSKLVCGLHVINNLQYISKLDNDKKGNKFVVE